MIVIVCFRRVNLDVKFSHDFIRCCLISISLLRPALAQRDQNAFHQADREDTVTISYYPVAFHHHGSDDVDSAERFWLCAWSTSDRPEAPSFSRNSY